MPPTEQMEVVPEQGWERSSSMVAMLGLGEEEEAQSGAGDEAGAGQAPWVSTTVALMEARAAAKGAKASGLVAASGSMAGKAAKGMAAVMAWAAGTAGVATLGTCMAAQGVTAALQASMVAQAPIPLHRLRILPAHQAPVTACHLG